MKVVFTAPALEDLREISVYMKSHDPGSMKHFEQRLSAVLLRVSMWPESAYEVSERHDVRLVTLRRYPFKIYYTLDSQTKCDTGYVRDRHGNEKVQPPYA